MFKAIDKFLLYMEKRISLVILIILMYAAYSAATRPYDPTDDAATSTRSGLYYYVDHGTGCEWIKASMFATLTPRLDSSGRQVCDG